ncbi:hypothetical protein ENSA5_01030 [Enhygromyxa salina]|uniref:Uncharacterized protein n=1 Tax=Enhygromyxa salina TaxID=215803 RepID=A0A2S9YL17_9BACT|nr:hypothetical protein [Enhygromyxa salina]PRQ05783.1 hypothetical protein ENSA5_01030 [Enhygromyxa salina]
MPDRPVPEPHCPRCRGLTPLGPRRSRLAELLGVRELMLGAAALGLMLGVTWVDERYTCEQLEDHAGELASRDAALDEFVDARCGELGCEQIEVVSGKGCLAKIRVRAPRVDDYGDEIGTFVTTEGLAYSPLFGRWRVRETLDDKQILGMPAG